MQLRIWLRRIPSRTRMGVLIAVIAIAGLAWQHYNGTQPSAAKPQQQASTASGGFSHDGDAHSAADGDALGEYQPDPSELPPPPDFSPGAARATVERFATNFASPHANRDDWLARISPDVVPELQDQYRLTDIRNVTQATVQEVTGPLTSDTMAPTFQVLYSDGSRVEVTVEMAIDGWKVSRVVPVDTLVDPAGPPPATELPAAPPGEEMTP